MYSAPKLERLGTFREVTLSGGEVCQADAVNPFHRYDSVPVTPGTPVCGS